MKLMTFGHYVAIGGLTLGASVFLSWSTRSDERSRNQVSVTYRVNCRDRYSGSDRAYSTVTATSWSRQAAIAEISRMMAQTNDLCQSNGDQTRVTVPGSGRFLN